MISIVIRRCPRQPLLTDAGVAELNRRSGQSYTIATVPRDNADLVAMARTPQNPDWIPMCADVRVVEIPDGEVWHVKGGDKLPEWIGVDG